MAMMDPYSERAPGVRNDFRQGREMAPLPLGDITCPALIIHGTHDADAEFYHGVRAPSTPRAPSVTGSKAATTWRSGSAARRPRRKHLPTPL